MASETSEKNKWIDAVGKLVSLTQERKLIWNAVYYDNDAKLAYVANYGSKTLKLQYSNLYLVEPGTGAEWEFPYTEATAHLQNAVEYQVVGVGNFLDELLSEAV